MHDELFAAATLPAAHGVHADTEPDELKPGAQGWHRLLVVLANEPGPHMSHDELLPRLTLPGKHDVQDVCPAVADVPAAQI